MWLFRQSIILVFAIASLIGINGFAENSMNCETGPIERTVGLSVWTVYSCSDKQSLIFVTKADNPAHPFFFIISPKDGKYQLYGEGTGSKEATKKVYEELKAYKLAKISQIIAATMKTKIKNVPVEGHLKEK